MRLYKELPALVILASLSTTTDKFKEEGVGDRYRVEGGVKLVKWSERRE